MPLIPPPDTTTFDTLPLPSVRVAGLSVRETRAAFPLPARRILPDEVLVVDARPANGTATRADDPDVAALSAGLLPAVLVTRWWGGDVIQAIIPCERDPGSAPSQRECYRVVEVLGTIQRQDQVSRDPAGAGVRARSAEAGETSVVVAVQWLRAVVAARLTVEALAMLPWACTRSECPTAWRPESVIHVTAAGLPSLCTSLYGASAEERDAEEALGLRTHLAQYLEEDRGALPDGTPLVEGLFQVMHGVRAPFELPERIVSDHRCNRCDQCGDCHACCPI